MVELDAAGRLAEANRWIAYHSPISKAYTAERTSYSSQLIPVTPYIIVACAETYFRYPEMMRAIDAACPAEDIGRTGHQPGSRVNAVHLWSIANFFLTGRKVIAQFDPSREDPEAGYTVMDFWRRAAGAFHHDDGNHQAHDTGGIVRPYGDEVIHTLLDGVVAVEDDETRARIKRFNATLVNYLFLLYFDTRVGTGDTGPYLVPGRLPDGQVVLVRDYYRMGESDFWWSDVAADLPYSYLTAALVLDDVDVRVSDFGSITTTPEDYLDRLVGFGLFTTDPSPSGDRSLRPVDLGELDDLVRAVKKVNAQHYRNVAAMSHDEMIRAGAYVYFTFLRPFADVAGITDELDWTVPRDLPDAMYQFVSQLRGEDVPFDTEAEYYEPYPG